MLAYKTIFPLAYAKKIVHMQYVIKHFATDFFLHMSIELKNMSNYCKLIWVEKILFMKIHSAIVNSCGYTFQNIASWLQENEENL